MQPVLDCPMISDHRPVCKAAPHALWVAGITGLALKSSLPGTFARAHAFGLHPMAASLALGPAKTLPRIHAHPGDNANASRPVKPK